MSNQHRPFIKLKNESGCESTHYSVVYEGLPEEFKLMAEKELNETDENRRRGLQKLKDYMKRNATTVLEDNILLTVLRGCKYNLGKSEAKLESFLRKRREIIEMVAELDMEKIENIIDDYGFGILPYRDKHGRGILYTRPYGINLDRYDIYSVGVILTVADLFLMKFPISSVAGVAYYGECKSPNIKMFYTILKVFRKIMFLVLSLPVRFSRIEILNANVLCHSFMKIVTPFVSKKIVSRVCLHGYGYEGLHQLYDPNILPDVFEGTMGPVSNTCYKQKLLHFIEDLKRESSRCTVNEL